jgi:2-dehydro-3-deoxyphosphogluconate aldolase / (4S)-4-hydroxy-2-oxoglutarate aldolase
MNTIIKQLVDTKILPLYYSDNYDLCKSNILACYNAGVKVFEFTNRGPYALTHFTKLKDELSSLCPELKLGIGTIYTKEEAQQFVEQSADFIAQPILSTEVAAYCKKVNVPWIPGVMTLNEIYQSQSLGAELTKIFPASVLGKGYLKSIKGPFPNANIMATGGIEADASDIKSWLEAGAKVCGLGSLLFNTDADTITQKLITIMNEI